MNPAQAVRALPCDETMQRNVLAIASGKGGVGKTWFSITLTHALARAGARALLFDGDLGAAGVGKQLVLTPERSRGGVVVANHAGGFDIVAGYTGPGGVVSLPAGRGPVLRNELWALGRGYDWVVIDLGTGSERTARLLAAESRTCLVVTTDEPAAITDAYAFIKIRAMEKLADNIQIVVNMAANEREGERTYQMLARACREFLKLDPRLAGIIRRDEHVKDAIRRHAPLLSRHPTCAAAIDAEAIARRLIDTL